MSTVLRTSAKNKCEISPMVPVFSERGAHLEVRTFQELSKGCKEKIKKLFFLVEYKPGIMVLKT